MPLTPADVHNVTFKKPMLGKRGYDEDEVDGFLDEVERELVRLNEENGELRAQVESLRNGAPPGAADHAEMVAALERVQREKASAEQEIQHLEAQLDDLHQQLVAAQQAAQQAQQQAAAAMQQAPGPDAGQGPGGEQEALRLLMVAQRTADEHLEDSRREADGLVTDARREADSLVGEARTQSEELVGQARDKAERLERDAQQRHQEVMGVLETKRASLLKHIEELKIFEREYRTRLKLYLESQLRDLNGQQGSDVDSDDIGQAVEAETTGQRPGQNAPIPVGGFGSLGAGRG
jgi:DivIVA domain-containing protein